MLSRVSLVLEVDLSRAFSLAARPRRRVFPRGMTRPRPDFDDPDRHVAAAIAIALLWAQLPAHITAIEAETMAQVSAASGLRDADTGQALQIGARLHAHVRILTDESGSARLATTAKDQVGIHASGAFVRLAPDPGHFLALERGSIAIAAAHRAQPAVMRVLVHGAEVSVIGTRFFLEAGTGAPVIAVQEGRVLVRRLRDDRGRAGDGRIPVGGG